jgi:hypothetical protein
VKNIGFVATALAITFALQVVWWRVRRPAGGILALLTLFALVFAILSVAALRLGVLDDGPADFARLALLYGSLALTYTILFSAVDAPSPTLSLVRCIADSGAGGCSEAELQRRLVDQDDMASRIRLMELGGMIRIENGLCKLTAYGVFLTRIFRLGAQALGLPQGG